MKPDRRTVLAGGAAALSMPFVHVARAAGEPLRIAILADMNGPYSTLGGAAAVAAVNLAVEDFRKETPSIPVDVVYADFQLKPDIGLTVARNWLDQGGVDAIADVPMSALALGLTQLLRDKNRVGLFTATATEDLSGAYCGPNHVHWTYDSHGMATAVANAIMDRGLDTWFFIAADYAMGASVVRDATKVITARGGKVVGTVRHPFPGLGDFSSLLLQAQGSGAKVICFANAGDDLIACIKQAAEFKTTSNGSILTAMLMDLPQVHSIGLKDAQGMFYSSGFYWEKNDGARAFSNRVGERVRNFIPSQNVAGAYSAALHYLRAAAVVGHAKAKADGAAVVAQMKKMQVTDPLYGPANIREDGRLMNPIYLLQAKTPAQSRGGWDYARIAGQTPPDKAYRQLSEGRCLWLKG